MANKSYHELTDKEWKMVEKNITTEEKQRSSTNRKAELHGDSCLLNTANGTASTRKFDNLRISYHGFNFFQDAPARELVIIR